MPEGEYVPVSLLPHSIWRPDTPSSRIIPTGPIVWFSDLPQITQSEQSSNSCSTWPFMHLYYVTVSFPPPGKHLLRTSGYTPSPNLISHTPTDSPSISTLIPSIPLKCSTLWLQLTSAPTTPWNLIWFHCALCHFRSIKGIISYATCPVHLDRVSRYPICGNGLEVVGPHLPSRSQ